MGRANCNGFLLVDPTGVVAAAAGAAPDVELGRSVEDALGVDMATLEGIASVNQVDERDGRWISTPYGRFRVERLTGAGGAPAGILLVRVDISSSAPPPSSGVQSRPVDALSLVAGRDPTAKAAVDLGIRLSKTMLPVYVGGEDGAGADILARAIIDRGPRRDAPVLHVPVARLLTSSSGGVRALTALLCGPPGSNARSHAASGGTIFIEDLHELDVETGRRIAYELDQGVLVEAHLVACGAPNLRERVAEGRFAKELHVLIRSSTVTLPPLREREDLEFLVRETLAARGGPRFDLAPDVLPMLSEHAWPGNLRELRMWIDRAVATADPERTLRAEHFPHAVSERSPSAPQPRVGLLRVAEKAALEEALRASGGNVSVAARKLGVARSTLYRLLVRHGVVR
ncbi:MAG: helix-turn-helix domain-containing protein [Polyangiaceae bacterium]